MQIFLDEYATLGRPYQEPFEVGKQPLPGLTRRRQAERAMFLS
jgi:hypothetical protein